MSSASYLNRFNIISFDDTFILVTSYCCSAPPPPTTTQHIASQLTTRASTKRELRISKEKNEQQQSTTKTTMVFWGARVKASKPIYFPGRDGITKLRITRATLGNENCYSDKKCSLVCTVGLKEPIYLCTLIPRKDESCHLNLEFEAVDRVTFSVKGNKSIYLAGYSISHDPAHSDTESYGIDIDDDEMESSSLHSEDNAYDFWDSFIDDSDYSDDLSPAPTSYYRGKEKIDRGKQIKLMDSNYSDDSEEDRFSVPLYKNDDGDHLKLLKKTECGSTSGVKIDGKIIDERVLTFSQF